ncbi:uncharacterized protein ACLA_098780 [Aspergillus clavatus NRRL 1]|uniref:Uncharacterized protein n=1 Tax=Aspergillus clavatus (strain ATCC 1007 / CBS 513.65 / DSM 816 / NCTC 3887 / NRRL 1 / QM 1276 / 107) TaxID=344612 RepID=A1CMZ9_ASPCL|nr:uncharacterized protein ACLA_098780 [Aspergillus clavatus NRRL 1]EAW08936.1 hypothetical protein ACLA_098780 [Aspergillus clavatus NRRL 1]
MSFFTDDPTWLDSIPSELAQGAADLTCCSSRLLTCLSAMGRRGVRVMNKYTLLLEDVQPEIFNNIMDIVFQSPRKVKMKLISVESE